jgi:hypothetical protein
MLDPFAGREISAALCDALGIATAHSTETTTLANCTRMLSPFVLTMRSRLVIS